MAFLNGLFARYLFPDDYSPVGFWLVSILTGLVAASLATLLAGLVTLVTVSRSWAALPWELRPLPQAVFLILISMSALTKTLWPTGQSQAVLSSVAIAILAIAGPFGQRRPDQ